MIANTHYGFCGGAVSTLEGNFTYTGSYNLRSDGVLELLTSGTFTPKKKMTVDVFLVGGGGGGAIRADHSGQSASGAGGGGGYTATYLNREYSSAVSVTIGAGGVGGTYSSSGYTVASTDGGNTTFGTLSVNGGKTPTLPGTQYVGLTHGGDGGSGGGGGGGSSSGLRGGGNGGSNGSDGLTVGVPTTNYYGGTGQGTTTREFGESTGKLYAGGGGGGSTGSSTYGTTVGYGGDGGGGEGGHYVAKTAGNGTPNSGGGGGGIAANSSATAVAGSGGTGIVCIRLST